MRWVKEYGEWDWWSNGEVDGWFIVQETGSSRKKRNRGEWWMNESNLEHQK